MNIKRIHSLHNIKKKFSFPTKKADKKNVKFKKCLFFFLSQDMQKGVQDQDLGFIVQDKTVNS